MEQVLAGTEPPIRLACKNQDQDQARQAEQGQTVASDSHEAPIKGTVEHVSVQFVVHGVPLMPRSDRAQGVVGSSGWMVQGPQVLITWAQCA